MTFELLRFSFEHITSTEPTGDILGVFLYLNMRIYTGKCDNAGKNKGRAF
jgi:hypothetical protein